MLSDEQFIILTFLVVIITALVAIYRTSKNELICPHCENIIHLYKGVIIDGEMLSVNTPLVYICAICFNPSIMELYVLWVPRENELDANDMDIINETIGSLKQGKSKNE